MADVSMVQASLDARFYHRYFIEQYNDTFFHIIDCNHNYKTIGRTLRDSKIKDIFDKVSSAETSMSRSRRNIKRIALSNEFEYFATWTVNAKYCNRFYIEDVIEKMRILLKAFQRSNKDFKYLYIIEKHEKGAFHFHGLIKGVKIGDEDKNLRLYIKEEYNSLPKYILDAIDKRQAIYHIPFFDNKLGYNTFTKIKSYNKCCNYICKYITEDMQRIASNYIYFSSKGLSKGYHYEVGFIPESLFKNSYEYINNGQVLARVKDIDITNLSDEDKLSWVLIQD